MTDDIRSRAILYARQAPMYGASPELLKLLFSLDEPLVELRIVVDNMVAAGFETGYAAAIDDRTPARPLRDPQRRTKPSSPGVVVRAAPTPRRKR